MSEADLVLGIDIGTSTAKVVLADAHGLVFLQKAASYEHCSPQPGYAEQNPADWWNAVCTGPGGAAASNKSPTQIESPPKSGSMVIARC